MDDATLYRVIAGEAATAEREAVARWRDAAAGNDERYRSLERLVATVDERLPPMPSAVARPDAREIIERAAARSARPSSARRRPFPRRHAGRLAAAAALVAVGVGLARFADRASSPAPVATEQFVTGPEEMATVTLQDGTVVRLAPRTTLRVTDWARERRVMLDGRAFFAVAHDRSRPFRIATAAGEVRVLGTRFGLDAMQRHLRLAVVEGRVALTDRSGGTFRVEAGEVAKVGAEGSKVSRQDGAEASVDWVGAFLAFQSTPLARAAGEIERVYGVGVVFEDPVLAERQVTAWFSERDLDEVVRTVCLVVAAECTIQGDTVLVSR